MERLATFREMPEEPPLSRHILPRSVASEAPWLPDRRDEPWLEAGAAANQKRVDRFVRKRGKSYQR